MLHPHDREGVVKFFVLQKELGTKVMLICGETGCGKTTQAPQFLLDHSWSKGETCKMVCTQPRRISAPSVAERIASERGETLGESVGYKIRLESKGGSHSPLVFCTNGIFLGFWLVKEVTEIRSPQRKGQIVTLT